MKTYDITLYGVQAENDELDARDLSNLLPEVLKGHRVHVNSIVVAERKSK